MLAQPGDSQPWPENPNRQRVSDKDTAYGGLIIFEMGVGLGTLNKKAERVGFEPTVTTSATTVFETAPIGHSGTSPNGWNYTINPPSFGKQVPGVDTLFGILVTVPGLFSEFLPQNVQGAREYRA